MKKSNSVSAAETRRGSALIALIAIFVLAGVIYGVRWWIKSHTPDPDTVMDLAPWKEWKIREKSEKPVQKLRAEQPKLDKPVKYDANVDLAGAPRGEILMWVSTDGGVGGNWSGTYYNEKKDNFDIQSSGFEGKVYPGKIYRDDKGEDPSRLYFLTKGKLLLHCASADSKQYHIYTGDIYVRGWLKPDMSVVSEIIITGDEKKSETFNWKVSRPVLKD